MSNLSMVMMILMILFNWGGMAALIVKMVKSKDKKVAETINE